MSDLKSPQVLIEYYLGTKSLTPESLTSLQDELVVHCREKLLASFEEMVLCLEVSSEFERRLSGVILPQMEWVHARMFMVLDLWTCVVPLTLLCANPEASLRSLLQIHESSDGWQKFCEKVVTPPKTEVESTGQSLREEVVGKVVKLFVAKKPTT